MVATRRRLSDLFVDPSLHKTVLQGCSREEFGSHSSRRTFVRKGESTTILWNNTGTRTTCCSGRLPQQALRVMLHASVTGAPCANSRTNTNRDAQTDNQTHRQIGRQTDNQADKLSKIANKQSNKRKKETIDKVRKKRENRRTARKKEIKNERKKEIRNT